MSKQKAQNQLHTSTPLSLKKRQRQILFGGFLMGVALLLALSFTSFYFNWQSDQSTLNEFADPTISSENIFNKFGALVSHFFIYQLFGISAFVLVYLFLLTGLSLFFNYSKKKPTQSLELGYFAYVMVMSFFRILL